MIEPTARPPHTEADVDAAWVQQALSRRYPSVRVNGLAIEDLTQGTSTRLRLVIDHDGGDEVPRHLFLKSSFDNDFRDLFTGAGIYEAEYRFYTELLPQLDVPTPSLHYAALDVEDGQFVLLLDDLVAMGATWGRATRPISVDSAATVVGHMAGYHGRFWDDPYLDGQRWLPTPAMSAEDISMQLFTDAGIQLLIEGPNADATPAKLRDGDRMKRSLASLMRRNSEGPRTLVHGDPHSGNFAFYSETEPIFTDWQVIRRGCWAHDLSYFLTMSMSIEDRRAHEANLLRGYLAQRVEAGGGEQSFDDAFLEYRAQPLYGLLMWVATPDMMQPAEITGPYVDRLLTAADDLDTLEAIEALNA